MWRAKRSTSDSNNVPCVRLVLMDDPFASVDASGSRLDSRQFLRVQEIGLVKLCSDTSSDPVPS